MGEYKGMAVIEHGDVITGKMATAFIKYEGENIPCSWFKELTATMEKSKNQVPRLGSTSSFTRTSGWEGTGEATMYYATSFFRKLAQQYHREGKDVYVDLVVTNDDPTSVLGTQTVVLKNVNFDDIVLARFDIGSDEPLDEDINFTFDDFEYLETFTHPSIPN